MIGRTIHNYVVRDKIGEGGMGVVYLAEHPRIGRKVAIKVLLPQFSANAEVVSRFFTEARASSAIKNEHIIDIIDFGELPDRSSYIIMEWLEGESLAQVLEREGAMSLVRVQHIARGIGRALAAAHRHGIVHRDLKPDNIFLVTQGDDREFVKVLDFGIAKLLGEEGQGSPVSASKTRTGAIIGTPMYMSPEQCRGVSVDERSDIYSFGIIVYQMLAGVLPFAAEGLGELLLMHMTETAKPLRELAPNLPESVERAVQHALEKDPQKRYTRVDQFVSDLGIAVTIQPGRTAPVAATHVSATDSIGNAVGETRVVQEPRGRRWPFIAVPLVLGAAVAAATWWHPAKPSDTGGIVGNVAVAAHPGVQAAKPDAPPVVPKPSAPATTARFEVRATPKEAKVVVDGVTHPNPWADTVPLDGSKHAVQLSAPGYVTYATEVTLDGPVSVVRSLDAAHPTKHGAHGQPPESPTTVAAPVATKTTAPDKPADKKPDTYKGTKGTLFTADPYAPAP